jgi:hypothetical protein
MYSALLICGLLAGTPEAQPADVFVSARYEAPVLTAGSFTKTVKVLALSAKEASEKASRDNPGYVVTGVQPPTDGSNFWTVTMEPK